LENGMTGRFITFEGIDGAGKSTQHAWLIAHLRALGQAVVATREPGGTPLGEQLRNLLLSQPMHIETEALLMFAARREHMDKVISPALTRGAWVVCDRFADASFAYQSGGRGLAWEKIETLRNWALGDFGPDLTFIFDLPVAIAQTRLAQLDQQRDRFEQEETDFFERVRAAYHRIAQENPQRVILIDAAQKPEVINKLLEKSIACI
jgi:dTMP kinase